MAQNKTVDSIRMLAQLGQVEQALERLYDSHDNNFISKSEFVDLYSEIQKLLSKSDHDEIIQITSCKDKFNIEGIPTFYIDLN